MDLARLYVHPFRRCITFGIFPKHSTKKSRHGRLWCFGVLFYSIYSICSIYRICWVYSNYWIYLIYGGRKKFWTRNMTNIDPMIWSDDRMYWMYWVYRIYWISWIYIGYLGYIVQTGNRPSVKWKSRQRKRKRVGRAKIEFSVANQIQKSRFSQKHDVTMSPAVTLPLALCWKHVPTISFLR